MQRLQTSVHQGNEKIQVMEHYTNCETATNTNQANPAWQKNNTAKSHSNHSQPGHPAKAHPTHSQPSPKPTRSTQQKASLQKPTQPRQPGPKQVNPSDQDKCQPGPMLTTTRSNANPAQNQPGPKSTWPKASQPGPLPKLCQPGLSTRQPGPKPTSNKPARQINSQPGPNQLAQSQPGSQCESYSVSIQSILLEAQNTRSY